MKGWGVFPGPSRALLCSLLCLLAILPAEPLLLPVAGKRIFRQRRVLLCGGVKMVVRRVLGIAGLGLAYYFCRMFPDFTAHKAGAMPQRGFSHKLRTVCAFCADIFLFHFKNLAMHEAVNGTTGNTAYALYRAGLFRRLLLFQLFALGLHTELCCRSLFLLALFAELGLWDTLSRSVGSLRPGLFPVRGVGGLRPSLLLGLIRFSFHSSYPPGV